MAASGETKRQERQQEEQRLRVHRDEEEGGGIEEEKEERFASGLLAEPLGSSAAKGVRGEEAENRTICPAANVSIEKRRWTQRTAIG